jgi:hypothetical protein
MARITLDDLVFEATSSALRALHEHEVIVKDKKRRPPKIWVGIWIDPTQIPSFANGEIREEGIES